MNAPAAMRRSWCPDMLRPMETADGLLVRIHPRGSVLSASQTQALAEGAGLFGNGLIDLSSRGNIQIRGVTADGHPRLVNMLMAAKLLEGVRNESPFRLTTVSPLAGIDPLDRIDAFALAERIEETGRSITGLHAKMSLVVDGGGAFPLDGIDADMRLVALSEARLAFGVARPTGTEWAGVLPLEDAPAAIGTILYAASGRRLRDLDDGQLTHLLQGLQFNPPEASVARPSPPRAGRFETGNEAAFLLAPPYGRCQAVALANAASWSERFGRGEIRLSPFKALVIPFASSAGCELLAPLAREAGFIVNEDDPRLVINTCPGMEGCSRGSTSTHADADRIAQKLPAGISLHLSGCAKGCARRASADLTLVGDAGAYQVVLGGTARDKPLGSASIDAIMERLADTSSGTDLMRVFEAARS